MFFKDEYSRLEHQDSFEYMKKLPDQCIDIIITDPPYFLSNDGFSNSGGKRVSVNKGGWDKTDLGIEKFYDIFLNEAKRVLKDSGSIWIFGTLHSIYTVGYLLQQKEFKILNNITWQKTNPAPNLSKRMFTHSTETILWARKSLLKGEQIYNYSLMKDIAGGKQMKDVWKTATISSSEKKYGKHPTQKPLAVMKRIIMATTDKTSLILDPFVGSGTTCVAGKLLKRRTIGVDESLEYLNIAKKRLLNANNEYEGKII
ncbi:site-specific DNA-methyltransferase [Pediococcus pentosaceus]|jgi:site-specific DNA-methyltransferase (adenine-specific)|uniref:DNA-methyltransferase n=1 Tax=Pediococcus pentosaceus TaxID=1255 RepID=UPI00265AAA54|nr:site-specific DNA-methyltransferase [Pediococcus pentosaceus]WKF71258.1 site-specific DNA-methyltransferase [Pediococcus pentosaceus]